MRGLLIAFLAFNASAGNGGTGVRAGSTKTTAKATATAV